MLLVKIAWTGSQDLNYVTGKTTERGLQSTGTNDQMKSGRQVISSQITKDSASTRSAHGFVLFSG